jgi:predicted DNA-binding transcriptional regulator AlpA
MPTHPAEQDDLFTPQTLARFLGMSEATIFLWRQAGKGPPWFKLWNGRVRYRREEVEAWMAAEDRAPAA